MPTITIEGIGDVEVGEEFLGLDEAGQQSYANEVARQISLGQTSAGSLVPTDQQLDDFVPGVVSALKRGVKGVGQAARDITVPFRSEETFQEIKAEMEKERELAAQEKRPVSFQALRDIYGEEGIGAALARLPQYATEQLFTSAPYMAGPVAAGLAAQAYIPPIPYLLPAKAAVGAAGFIGAGTLQFFGMDIGRQMEEGAETKEDLDVAKAAIAAPVQATLDFLLFRLFGLIGKTKGSASAEKQAVEFAKKLSAGTVSVGAKGFAKGGGTEIITEVTQQILERWQAGLNLTDDEALSEYLEAGAASLVVGGVIGGASEIYQNKQAKKNLFKAAEEAKKEEEARAKEVQDNIASEPDGPLQITYQEGEFTTDTPAAVVETIIDESVNDVAPTGLGEDIGAAAPLGPFTVAEMPNGGFSVVNAIGEVRTPTFQTLDLAQEAADLLTERVPTAIESAELEFTEASAKRALQDNKIAETAATLEAARETVTPLGFFNREEIGGKLADQINRKRLLAVSLRPGETVQNDGLYTIEEIAETGASNETLSSIIAKKKPLTEDASLNVTVRDIQDLASTKNIRFGDEAFKTFALRTTGKSMPQNMLQVQRNALFERLDAMPEFQDETSIPIIKYPHFTAQQIADVAKAIRETGSVSDKLILESIGAPKIKGARRKEVSGEIRRELIRRGILKEDGKLKKRVVLRGAPERTPAPNVKEQELLQKLVPLEGAINDRFQARVKDFPALKDVRLKFSSLIESMKTGEIQTDAEGVFRTEEGKGTEGEAGEFFKTIRLAIDVVTDSSKTDAENISALSEVLDHEFIHAAYEAGVVTDQEKAALETFVKKAIRPNTGKTYYQDRVDSLKDRPSEETLVEEAVAEAFRDFAAGRRVFAPKIKSIFRKIAEFFRLIKEAAADVDIITGNEIFERLDAGVQTSATRQKTTARAAKIKPAEKARARVADFPTEESFSRKRSRKKPAPVGESPFPIPSLEDVEGRLRRKAGRKDVAGATTSTGPRNQRQEIYNDEGDVVAVIGRMTFDDWINQTEGRMSEAEIAAAREWYPEAAVAYQKYFGKDWPNYLAAWLMANQQASPSTAAMNAVRSREQALTYAAQAPVAIDVNAGLAANRLFDFWLAMEAGGEIPSGGAQKLYDFVDSGLLRETRTWMNNDVRGGAPAVADVHSLRDTGFVDKTYQSFLQENYGVKVDTDTSGSPDENQYERSGDFLRALSDYLNDINYKGGGWTPYQVQSVGWMATTKFLGKPGQTAEESILFNIRNLPFEVAFGDGAPFSETYSDYFQLPAIGQKEVTERVAEAATDFARDVTGVAEINRYVSTGGWLDDSLNPNMVEQIVASPEAMTDMASIIGYLVEQTAMFPYRVVPKKTSKSKLALKIRPSDVAKDRLNNDTNMSILWDKLRNADLARTKKAEKQLAKERKAGKEDARLPDDDNIITGYTATIDENGNSAMLVLFDTKKDALLSRLEPDGDVANAIAQISEEIGVDLEGEAAFYEGDYIENNWTEDKTGGVYLQRIHQRYGPAVAARVEDFKRGELEPLLEDSIRGARLKYGNRERFSRRRTEATEERPVQDSGSLSRSERQLQAQDRSGATSQEEERVEGLPSTYNIAGIGDVSVEPFAPARQAARDYGQTVGRSMPELSGNYVYGPVDGERASRIAQAFEDMPNTPEDSFTQAAYNALAEEVMTQYDFMKDTGIQVEFYPSDVDPYAASPREMIEDVKQNNHMYVFPTDSGYGMDGITAEEVADNPMLRLTDEYISGRRARVNDIFRAVHDYFGHVKEGFGFRAAGEDAAYASHAVMFSPLARVALASETRGQNSWVNFGPEAKQNENASPADTIYADQKVGILPEFVINEGIENLVEPVNLQELQDETNFNTQGFFVPDEKFSRKYVQDSASAAANRFVKRARADGTRSDNWGKLKTASGEILPVRMAAGRNYEDGGGYGQAHAELHDDDFQAIPELPFTSANAAIGAALDAFTQARVSGVGRGAFKIFEGKRDGSQTMLWRPEGSKTDVKIVFDRQTDDRSGQTFFGITTAFPDSVALRKDYERKQNEEYTKAGLLSSKFSALSDTAQETVLTFKERKPSDRPILKLNKKAKEKFSRGGTVKEESPEVQELINRTQVVNEDKTAGQAFLDALFGRYKESPLFDSNWERIQSWFRERYVEKFNNFSVLATKAGRLVAGQTYADANAYAAVIMAGQHAQITKAAWYDGVPVYDKEKGMFKVLGEVDGQTITGLADILKPVLVGRTSSQFGTYAMARRAQRVNVEGIRSGMTDNDIAVGLALADKYEYFPDVFDQYQIWNSYLVKFMVDTGLITPEMGEIWVRTADYTPYYRQEQQGASVISQLSREGSYGMFDPQQQMSFFYPDMDSAFIEGERAVKIPLDGKRVDKKLLGAGNVFQLRVDGEIQVEQYDSYNKAVAAVRSLRNTRPDANVELYKTPQKVDDFLDNVARNTATAIQGGMKNIAAQRVIRDSLTLGIAFEVDGSEQTPLNTIQIRVDGKDRYFEIVDRSLYNSMMVLSQNNDNLIDSVLVGILSSPSRLLRELVTRDPGFMLRNMMRDTLSAWVTSGQNYTPFIDTFGGFVNAIKDGSEGKALRTGGVAGGYDFAGTPKDMARYVESKIATKDPKGVKEKAISPFKKLWDATTFMTNASETATRSAVYKRVLEKTGNEAQALYEALEVLNFNRRGAGAEIRLLTALIPFLNARIQGLDVLYRAGFTKNTANPDATRKAFAVKASLIVGATALYTMLMKDTECYKKATPEARDLNWFIPNPLGGPCVKIPTPFEVGAIFKIAPERIIQYGLGNDLGRDVRESFFRNLRSTFQVDYPQFIRPFLEVSFNKSVFTGREIVPYYMQGLDPDLQKFDSTSSLAVSVGRELGVSPLQIDHLIKGYTATLGSYALSAASSMIDAYQPTGKPLPPDKNWYNMPLIRSFFQDPKSRGTVVQFYELDRHVRQAVNSFAEAEKQGDAEKMKEIAQERASLLALEDTMKDIRNDLKEVREQKNQILRSAMDPSRKRELLNIIREEELAITATIPILRQIGYQ